MVQLVRLGDAKAHATANASSAHNFAAVIQHITTTKRMRIDRAQQQQQSSRVSSYHVLHIADPTKSFFKLLCWGETLPTLKREDHEGEAITLCVGDIVLFSSCVIKSFRGNVEAQYTRNSSVQLLYRRDRYFNTRDVRLKDLFPMIEWYKQHRHEFLLVANAPPLDEVSSSSSLSSSSQQQRAPSASFAMIRELREDMLTNIRCKIHESKKTEVEASTGQQQIQIQQEQRNSGDYDGVQLCEVVMVDARNETMILNLWDQHSEPRFVTRLLAHRGAFEILGLVVTNNALTSRLLANSTPRTEFKFIGDTSNGSSLTNGNGNGNGKRVFATVEALESASLVGHVVLESVAIESVILDRFFGNNGHIEPAFTPLLVESYCSVCGETLPVLPTDTIPHLFGSCLNRCRVKNGESERLWRYRTIQMVLRDSSSLGRLIVQVGDEVLTRLLGNIHAELLIYPHDPRKPEVPFSPRAMVATLMNALVQGSTGSSMIAGAASVVPFRAELEKVARSAEKASSQRRRTSLLLNDSLRSQEDGDAADKAVYVVLALAPNSIQCLW